MKLKAHFLLLVMFFVSSAFGLGTSSQFKNGALEEAPSMEDRVSFNEGRNYNFLRRKIFVPEQYGHLVTILINNGMTEIWFESDDGILRNVIVDTTTPVIIKREGNLK